MSEINNQLEDSEWKELQSLLKGIGTELHLEDLKKIHEPDASLDCLRQGHLVEFEWTLVFTTSIFDKNPLGAETYYGNNKRDIALDLEEVLWNPTWQCCDCPFD